ITVGASVAQFIDEQLFLNEEWGS
ncbi:MAG: hypothetical protein EZS28_043645, partial [Streblomastix strix]